MNTHNMPAEPQLPFTTLSMESEYDISNILARLKALEDANLTTATAKWMVGAKQNDDRLMEEARNSIGYAVDADRINQAAELSVFKFVVGQMLSEIAFMHSRPEEKLLDMADSIQSIVELAAEDYGGTYFKMASGFARELTEMAEIMLE